MTIILSALLLLICWFLVAPIDFKIDTRIPIISLRWISIGKATVKYGKDGWQLNLDILFFHRSWSVEKMLLQERKIKKVPLQPTKANRKKPDLRKILQVARSFSVKKWEIAIDSGDTAANARLYPLNFIPRLWHHVHINFEDQNYLVLVIRNAPWRMVYAWIK